MTKKVKDIENELIKYSTYKQNKGFEKFTEKNMDEWARISHAIHSIGHNSEKYFLKYLRNSNEEKSSNSLLSDSSIPQMSILFDIDVPFPGPKEHKFTFIDLFAGIGGFRIAMQEFGGKCVFSSEWDKYARMAYEANFGEMPYGDITKIDENEIPEHDILCAGFPCQAFSVSGKQKGFEDTRGTLFFDILRIVKKRKPRVLFLENVKNLEAHDGGKTLKVIINSLETIGYEVFFKVLNSSNYGLPQNRSRIYIVAFSGPRKNKSFKFPDPSNKTVALKDLLESDPKDAKIVERDDIEIKKEFVPQKNIFGEIELPNRPIQIGKVNKGGQGERIYNIYGHAITLSAYGGGVGSKTGLYLVDGKIRKLSPRECARVQGYPDKFIIKSSVSQAYKQFGNSVSISVLRKISEKIVKEIGIK